MVRLLLLLLVACSSLQAQIPAQPLHSQAKRLVQALDYLGSPLQPADKKALQQLFNRAPDTASVAQIQKILDPYCLAMIDINAEARVKAIRGPAKAVLMQNGWKTFLIKINNHAGITTQLQVASPNAAPLLHMSHKSYNTPHVMPGAEIPEGAIPDRFLEIGFYTKPPLAENLSGLALEYAVLQLYTKSKGEQEAVLQFHIGQENADLAARNVLPVLFRSLPAVKVKLEIKDENKGDAMASITIRDGIERLSTDAYQYTTASKEYNFHSKSLEGLYPLPSRRLAETDEYPDFFFQPQFYRQSGEHVFLPPGSYAVTVTRGPEYIPQNTTLHVPEDVDSMTASFTLKRWVNMAKLGWFSADHHVHASGCSHYDSPQEGVDANSMMRQVKGEDLNVAAVLTWGPGWYHQKAHFTGRKDSVSTAHNLMRYDVEISGFPSSPAGHLVLLNLKEDDYPNTKDIEEWPSWTGPVLQWAKSQGALTGYAHSGWGLQPANAAEATNKLPNLALPAMDGIGANEYIVTVTQGLIDFFSAGDTPAPWELNMWYHTLNCGFRTRISGETDFPCIFDERVGVARSYFKAKAPISYEQYIDAIKNGRSYVSDGRSHILDFSANKVVMGEKGSELKLKAPGVVQVHARVTALLDSVTNASESGIAKQPIYEPPWALSAAPYWNVARARIGNTRTVPVELLFNGVPVDTVVIDADGKWKDVSFSYRVAGSGWLALRIYPSSHTNPIFVTVAGQPIRVKESIAWCRKAVDQCWTKKESNFREAEKAAARAMYDKARAYYDQIK